MAISIKKIFSYLKNLFIIDERKTIEQYLSQSTDIYDLEQRIRNMDRKKFF